MVRGSLGDGGIGAVCGAFFSSVIYAQVQKNGNRGAKIGLPDVGWLTVVLCGSGVTIDVLFWVA